MSKRWVEKQYAYFRDKIALIEGKYYDLGHDLALWGTRDSDLEVGREPPAVGAVRRPFGRIVQAIGEGNALVETDLGRETVVYYVEGIPAEKNISDAPLDLPLVYLGPKQYVTVLGAPDTVQGYRVLARISPKEFEQALRSGFKLVRYRFKVETGEVVGTPVP